VLAGTAAVSSAVAAPFADPTPAPSTVLVERATACYESEEDSLCRRVHDWTGNEWLAESAQWAVAKPARIIAIVVVAVVLRRIVHRAINRLSERAGQGSVPGVLSRGRPAAEAALVAERRKQRSATMASVLRSLSTGVIGGICVLMVLAELTFNIGPLIASAGIIGVALGFGAQSLVKDFLSGIFMILEDQYGVGDDIDVGTCSGVVEAVGLRVTRLRDLEGTVWYVRNGEILRVGNKSHGWARAVIDVDIAKGEDIARVRERLTQAGNKLMAIPEYRELILEEPSVWGVQALSANSVVMRVVVKTLPGMQFKVARALREIIKVTMDENDIEIPFPQRTVWVRTEGPGSAPGDTEPPPGDDPSADPPAGPQAPGPSGPPPPPRGTGPVPPEQRSPDSPRPGQT
jgi:small-conductance mechanosensitive channel